MPKPTQGRVNIRHAIAEHGGVIKEVAGHFGVTRQTIYNWLDYYDLRGEVEKARTKMRAVAQDVIYQRLMSEDDDRAFEAARFVMLHLDDTGDPIRLSVEATMALARLGIPVSDVAREFEEMIRAMATLAPQGTARRAPTQAANDNLHSVTDGK